MLVCPFFFLLFFFWFAEFMNFFDCFTDLCFMGCGFLNDFSCFNGLDNMRL